MKTIVLVMIFTVFSIHAMEMDFSKLDEAKPEDCYGKLRISVNKYLTKFSNEKDIKKFNAMIDDAVNEDQTLTEQGIMDKKIIDFYSDHKKEFETQLFTKETLVKGCMFLKRIFDHKLKLPKQMEDELDKHDIEQITETINKELKNQIADNK